MKVRGYIAVGAGIFLVVLMAGLTLFIGNLVWSHSMSVTPEVGDAFLGRIFVGFALIAVCGVIGIGNGMWLIRKGRPNAVLTILAVVIFLSAINQIWQASKILGPA